MNEHKKALARAKVMADTIKKVGELKADDKVINRHTNAEATIVSKSWCGRALSFVLSNGKYNITISGRDLEDNYTW